MQNFLKGDIMKRLFEQILRHRKTVILLFGLACIISAFMSTKVQVNYNLVDYLPDDAASTKALDQMEEEYGGGVPNARMMVEDIRIPEAITLKQELENVEGITEVTWLDDAVDVTVPLETMDQDILDDYYKDNTALYTLTVDDEEND